MLFGEGYAAADDVVGHELTHGVTQNESRLIYANESGAINEAFSDIWGEWMDQGNGSGDDSPGVKWELGEDLPIGAIRDMSDPPTFRDPDRMGSPHWYSGTGDYGGVHTNSGVANKLAYLLTDGDAFNGYTVSGMGISRVAELMYECQTNLLSPGSDYADLANAMFQATINLGFTQSEKDNVRDACQAVEILGENQSPILSNPRVLPTAGNESTTFEFLVDYYDADGDAPLSDCGTLYISGANSYEFNMTLKSGSAEDGIYHYTTTLPEGSYSYWFAFADTNGAWDQTDSASGPTVGGSGNAAINIVIQCQRVSSDLWLKYSLTSSSGPWTDIPITQQILDPLYVPLGSHVWFQAGVRSANYEYREWELKYQGTRLGGDILPHWDSILNPSYDEVGLNVFYGYTPQQYTISGTVKKSDGALVPGGVDLTLGSDEQTLSQHTDDGNWTFTGVVGGVTVSVTASADGGYTFSPAHLLFRNLSGDKADKEIVAHYFDDYVPMTTFLSIPPSVSDNSSVSFSWIGEDNKSAPATLQYQCKLESVDADWTAWGSATTKAYDLANGAYTFWVRAKDEAGNVNQAPMGHEFVVNAAPKVTAAVRSNGSVWCSRVTLEIPSGASHPTDAFVLLPEHSGMRDPELVPVRLHRADEVTPCGANEIVAVELGLTARIVAAQSGWQVTLPDSITAGQSAQYDVVWGKIQYYGWQEFVDVPLAFPNSHVLHGTFDSSFAMGIPYLDSNWRLWRAAWKNFLYGGTVGETRAWMFMNVSDRNGPIINETIVEHVYGVPYDGIYGYNAALHGGRILQTADRICLLWQDRRVEVNSGSASTLDRYGGWYFNLSGGFVNQYGPDYLNDVSYTLPNRSVGTNLWFMGRTSGATTADPNYEWFTVADSYGNETIAKTDIDTVQNANGSSFWAGKAYPIGQNVLLVWHEEWYTATGRDRRRIKYQVRNQSGALVKSTAILGTVIDDSVDKDDTYEQFSDAVTDLEGKVWISYMHQQTGQANEFLYIVLDANGDAWTGPTVTPQRIFRHCDADGKIWIQEDGQFIVLNPDNTQAAPPRSAVYWPTQKIGVKSAVVSNDGYRLYDRWSPHLVAVDVPAGPMADTMELFDLNLWGNDLHPANLTIKEGDTTVWSHGGQFTGHTTADTSGVFEVGPNLLSMTQNDFLGGQILLTFPYALLHSVTATASSGGSIDPEGQLYVVDGSNHTFTFDPNTSYHIDDVIVDSASLGPMASYEFTNVTEDHSIHVGFAAVTLQELCDHILGIGHLVPDISGDINSDGVVDVCDLIMMMNTASPASQP